eukprot:4671277-Pyramimonas_sp.AAC.1
MLRGRCAAVSFQTLSESIGLVAMYVPPCQTSTQLRRTYEEACHKMLRWFQETMEEMPRERIIPFVRVDLNGGLPSNGDDMVAGPYGCGKESYATTRYARACPGWGLTAANAHYANPPSYVGNDNASYIDHL